jgi:hypothetical protein
MDQPCALVVFRLGRIQPWSCQAWAAAAAVGSSRTDGCQQVRFEGARGLRIAAAALRGKGLPQRPHQRPTAEHKIDAVGDHRLGERAVEFRASWPELTHVADDRDAAAARANRRLAEQRERSPHRGRIGIIALVD